MATTNRETEMAQLRELTVTFNPETGAIQYNEGDRPVQLVSIAEFPEIDGRNGQRDSSYLEERIWLPDQKNTIQILNPYNLFPRGFFSKENGLGIAPREDLRDAYVIHQGNNRSDILEQKVAMNFQLFNDLNRDKKAFENHPDRIKINSVYFTLLSKEQANDIDYVLWGQTSVNDGVSIQTPKQNRDTALRYWEGLVEKFPQMPKGDVDARVAKTFSVSPGMVQRWKASRNIADYLMTAVDNVWISYDLAQELSGFYNKNQGKIGLEIEAVTDALWSIAVQNSVSESKNGKVKPAKITDKTCTGYFTAFGLNFKAAAQTPTVDPAVDPNSVGNGEGELASGDRASDESSTPDPTKTFEQIIAEAQTINFDAIIDRVDQLALLFKSGVIESETVGKDDKAKTVYRLTSTNVEGVSDSLTESAVGHFLKAINALGKLQAPALETLNETRVRQEAEKADQLLKASQAEQGEAAKQPATAEPVAV